MKRYLIAVGALGLIASGILYADALSPAQVNGCQYLATPPSLTDQQTVVVTCDSAGNIRTTATISGSVTANTAATATATAPSYVEGSSDPLSMDLSGRLRVTGAGGAFPITAASGAIASGAYASGAFASGSIASGAVASGAIASGAVASGAYASGAYVAGSISDGADVTLGAKADAKSTATDTTAITVMQVLKEISFMEQTPASRAVTNAGTFAVQSTPAVSTAGGITTTYVLEPAASDNHANIKNGAGNVYWMSAFNNSATINYIRLYNAATGFNGCNSATNLVWEGHIPASTSDAGFIQNFNTPISFTTGISICVTGAYGQTNTTNATASAISITIGYN